MVVIEGKMGGLKGEVMGGRMTEEGEPVLAGMMTWKSLEAGAVDQFSLLSDVLYVFYTVYLFIHLSIYIFQLFDKYLFILYLY